MSNDVVVAGGGLFGVTAAHALARAGLRVALIERGPGLLPGASSVNQYRLHRGFHYPRSPETVAACLAAEERFRMLFPTTLIDSDKHYYAVAQEGSRLTASEYLASLERLGLGWRFAAPPFIDDENVTCCIRVDEGAIDVPELRVSCWKLLDEAGVRVQLSTPFEWSRVGTGETVVLATYAANNALLRIAGLPAPAYRYQVAELLCVRLPDEYRGTSCLVMDGAFPSLDPCGRSGHHVVGHVTLMHHAEATAVVSPFHGTATDRRRSAAETWRLLTAAAAPFYRGVERGRVLGSRLAIRTTLPDVGATDERPTVVTRHDERVYSVLAGKLSTCVEAADTLVSRIAR